MAEAEITNGTAPRMRRLPPLRGWVLALYTLIWVPALLAAIAAPLVSTWIGTRMIATGAFYSLGMDYTTEPLQAGAVWGEAKRAGVRPGDMIVAIDGRAPAGLLTLPDQLARPEGAPVRIGLERAGRRFTVALTQSRAEDDAPYAAAGISRPAAIAITIAQILGPMLILTVAAILLFRKRRDPVAAMLSLSFLLICSLSHMGSIAWDVAGLDWLNGVLNRVAWPLLAAALMVFPSGRFDMKWIGPAFVFALASMFLMQLPRLPYAALLYWLLGLQAAGVAAQVLRYRRLAPGPERQQLRWAFAGLALSLVLLVAVSPFLVAATNAPAADLRWIVWMAVIVYPLTSAGIVMLPLGLLVSLLKYRLYDVDAAISRSVAYGTLTLLLVAIFAGSEKVIELLGERYFGEELGVIAGGLGAAIAAIMIVPLHHRVSHWAEHRFQRNLIHLRHDLPLLLGDLRETAGVARIAEASLDNVAHGVRARRVALMVGDAAAASRGCDAAEFETWRRSWQPPAHEGPDSDRGDPVFPLRVPLAADGHGRVGWLLLGPRPDGSFYGKDEREVLAEIADPVARAIQVARLREERDGAISGLLADVGRRITALERAVAR